MTMRNLFAHFAVITAFVGGTQPAGADDPAQSPPRPPAHPAQPRVTLPARIDVGAELLGRLKPAELANLANTIERDWPERPEWAEMALAIMRGEAMQTDKGWWRPTGKKYGWTWLKGKYDANSDSVIERSEFPGTEARKTLFFTRLDVNLDGQLSAADFESSAAPPAGPLAMKKRMSEMLLMQMDVDSNGQITRQEMADFFERADREKSSFLTAEDILSALDDGESRRTSGPSQPSSQPSGPRISQMLTMFFSGQMGWFEEGPKLGEMAPDFTLATFDNQRTINLTESRRKKPVVLIFGSFT